MRADSRLNLKRNFIATSYQQSSKECKKSELNIHQPVPASPTAVSRKQSTAGSNRNKIQNINTRYKSTHLRAQDSNNSIPSFENNLISNVTAQEGSIAVLPCHVRNLGDRPVTWIRRRDWHIITSGVITYSTDDRYQVVHNENSDNWDLQIKYATKRDNGTYECQAA
ncbi:hypothetical protein V9T40_002140 [Parthenolecanium corni]|uniref:Ig-like domain-containing protein n=1 Tax=Parthenolecanium corni TaxID=536013 RepID=A0AAN9TFQ6_9HEMI